MESQSGTQDSYASPGLKQEWKCKCSARAAGQSALSLQQQEVGKSPIFVPGFLPANPLEMGRSQAVLGLLSAASVWTCGKHWSNGTATTASETPNVPSADSLAFH